MKRYKIKVKYKGKPQEEVYDGDDPTLIPQLYSSEFGYTDLHYEESTLGDAMEAMRDLPTPEVNDNQDFKIPSQEEILKLAFEHNNSGQVRVPSMGNTPNVPNVIPTPQIKGSSVVQATTKATYKEYMVGDTKVRINLRTGVLEEHKWVTKDMDGNIGFKHKDSDQIETNLKDYKVFVKEWVEVSEPSDEEDA